MISPGNNALHHTRSTKEPNVKEIRIPKGNGQYRTVYSPSRAERRELLAILPTLQKLERQAASKAGTEEVAHGFILGRNPVTAALPHVGYAVTVCCDLASWFDSVTPEQIAEGLCETGMDAITALETALKVCHLDAPRQGLPTSPTAANIAAIRMDRAILAVIGRDKGAVYTRYADDLTLSLTDDSPATVDTAKAVLIQAAHAQGWTIAEHKTELKYARAGRRVICGVSVGETDINAPRWMRRKLRAATHQGKKQEKQAAGLREWCAMKLPKLSRSPRQIQGCIGNVSAKETTETKETTPETSPQVMGGTSRRIVIDNQHS